MCNFVAQKVCRNGRRAVSSYLDADTIKYQYRMLNQNPLYQIAGYIMGDAVGDRYLKRLSQIRLNLTDVPISSYWYIIERLDLIKQSNKLAAVLGDIESEYLGEKEDEKKIAMYAYDHRKNKY